MLFKCEHCCSPVAPGASSCNRPLCKERELERQSVLKCRELGIPFRPELYRAYGRIP